MKVVPIDSNVIMECIEDYESYSEYRTKHMAKADPRVHIDYFTDIVAETLKEEVSFVSGNYYKHSMPYMPHTDYKKHLDNSINFVIPLNIRGDASLVIFDQMWMEDSVTWNMNLPIPEFKVNTLTKGSPNEFDITNKTKDPFDSELHKKHLHYFDISLLEGMTADIFDFVQGQAVIFDNRRIHCTSHDVYEKLGLSLRFKYETK